MNTTFLLMARYSGLAIVPAQKVVEDFFPHLSVEKFIRKTSTGEIQLPLVRIDPQSQKCAKGIHLNDLARYLDERHQAAQKEARQLAL